MEKVTIGVIAFFVVVAMILMLFPCGSDIMNANFQASLVVATP